ncbi:MAG: fluoride efflux transporter CrcB [Saezia sp.]
MLKHVLLVGLGGGVGSMLRYLASIWINKSFHSSVFPLATFAVNISGCFLIGLFTGLALKYAFFNNELRYLLVAGFCGGYTTFSAFSAENFMLIEKGNYIALIAYAFASIFMGVLAFYIGHQIAKA